MKKVIVAILIFLYSVTNYSQDTLKSPKDTIHVPMGIYTTFAQFNAKSPEKQMDFTLNSRTSRQIWAWGGTEYEIKFADKSVKKRFIHDSIWAVSDGKHFYINNKHVSANKGFDKLEKLDFPLSYFVSYVLLFDEHAERASVANLFGPIAAGYAAIPYKRVVAMDMRNGTLIRLNEFGFTNLLKDDPELMQKYKAISKEKDNELAIFQILEEYNTKFKNNH